MCGARAAVIADQVSDQLTLASQPGRASHNESPDTPPPAQQVIPVAAPTPAAVACSTCGALGEDGKFCGACGAPLVAATGKSPTAGGSDGVNRPARTAGVPDSNTGAGNGRDLGQIWSTMDKGVLKEAVARTAGAWVSVWLVLVVVLALVRTIADWDPSDLSSLSLPFLASSAQLLGLAAEPQLSAEFQAGISVSGEATAKFTLLSVGLLQFIALRLVQTRRRQLSDKRLYAVASSAVSVAAVLLMLRIASSSITGSFGSTGSTTVDLTWSWLLPVAVSVGLTLLAVFGVPAVRRHPSLNVAVGVLGRFAVLSLWVALLAAAVFGVYQGLATGAGSRQVDVQSVIAQCFVLVLLLPTIAIVVVGKILGLNPAVGGGDFARDWAATLADVPGYVAWIAFVVGVVLLVALAYWLTSEKRLVPSNRMWVWLGSTFALAGLIATWLVNVSVVAHADAVFFTRTLTTGNVGFDAFQFAWRLGLVGVIVGLVVHPSVLPTILRWRQLVPTVDATNLLPKRLREISSRVTIKQPVLAEAANEIGTSGKALLWGVVGLFALAILAVPIGKVLSATLGNTAQDAVSGLQSALESGSGSELQSAVGVSEAPVSTGQPVPNPTAVLDSGDNSRTSAYATVTWPNGQQSNSKQEVSLSADYAGFLGLIPKWRVYSMDVPRMSLSDGSASQVAKVTVDGTTVGPQGVPVMPGKHEVQVAQVGTNVSWEVANQHPEVAQDQTIDVTETLTTSGLQNAQAFAALHVSKGCAPDGTLPGCPTNLKTWASNKEIPPNQIRVTKDAENPGVFLAEGPELKYRETDLTPGGYDYTRTWSMLVPLQVNANGDWEVAPTQ